MGAVVTFNHPNGVFEVEEGSPTFERLVEEGHTPLYDVGPAKKKRAAPAAAPGAKAPTKAELIKALEELDVEIDPAWKVADLAGALEWTLATIDEGDAGNGGD